MYHYCLDRTYDVASDSQIVAAYRYVLDFN